MPTPLVNGSNAALWHLLLSQCCNSITNLRSSLNERSHLLILCRTVWSAMSSQLLRKCDVCSQTPPTTFLPFLLSFSLSWKHQIHRLCSIDKFIAFLCSGILQLGEFGSWILPHREETVLLSRGPHDLLSHVKLNC